MLRYVVTLMVLTCAVACLIGVDDGTNESGDTSVLSLIDDPLTSTTVRGFKPERRQDQRPMLSEAQYAELAGVLREVYTKPIESWPKANVDEGVAFVEMGAVGESRFPENNPFTKEKATLGKLLFFDGRLSGTSQMSCGSCHVAELGWGDGRARSLGHGAKQLGRNTPSMLNAAFADRLFWDGRAGSLEELVVAVLTNEHEMSTTPDAVVKVVKRIKGYELMFVEVFGDSEITMQRIAMAMATHVRTVVSEPSSKFDRMLKGHRDALSDSALRGLHLFRTDARCVNCHMGPQLTDQKFHNLGLSYYGRKFEDLGQYNFTGRKEDVGKFRTPSLRNIARTAPYTHVGFFDLKGMINMYNAGMPMLKRKAKHEGDELFPTKSELLKPLHLNKQDRADLQAFLESLTERRRRDLLPELPE
ncbi:cytochrome-c peroxidase [Poriferisphaera sp. WC338]|uniref:cytochrome-c peroxidase n=1 Tax=Poriferisphaera sp. WC338 TaxID=3425129 RepID=UPI003D815FA3